MHLKIICFYHLRRDPFSDFDWETERIDQNWQMTAHVIFDFAVAILDFWRCRKKFAKAEISALVAVKDNQIL